MQSILLNGGQCHTYIKKDILKTLGFKFKDLVLNLFYYPIYGGRKVDSIQKRKKTFD